MRGRIASWVTLVLVGGLASAASAATFPIGTGAGEWSGALTLSIGRFLPPVSVAANPGSSIQVTAGVLDEPAGVFGLTTIRVQYTGMPQLSGLTITGFGNGTKTGPLSAATGALAGNAIVNVLQLLNLTIPLSVVGQAGASAQVSAGSIVITVIGHGWTTGTTAPLATLGNTVSAMGTNDLDTSAGTGAFTLVSGFRVVTNVAGTLPGFAFQTFVSNALPEPGTALLLAAGVATLVLLGWERRRR